MRTTLICFLIAVTANIAGCSAVSEPWDTTGAFKSERAVPDGRSRMLRERAEHGQTDRQSGVQQMNRT